MMMMTYFLSLYFEKGIYMNTDTQNKQTNQQTTTKRKMCESMPYGESHHRIKLAVLPLYRGYALMSHSRWNMSGQLIGQKK